MVVVCGSGDIEWFLERFCGKVCRVKQGEFDFFEEGVNFEVEMQ